MKKHGKKRAWLAALAILALLGAGLAFAVWDSSEHPEITEYRVCSDKCPDSFDGFKIIQLSDLHGADFGGRLAEELRRQDPDIIALTGDLADEFTDVSMLPPLLEGLTALAPAFYVTGNHEWVLSREKRQALFDLLDAAGVIRLPNECRLLEKGGASIVLAGVDDPNGPYDQKRPAQLVREIRQQYGKDAYILMLSHRNDELPLWAHMGVQTVLCGHGHGGIVRLPGIGAVFGTHMDLFPDYTAGLYEKDGTAMVVSRGLGGSRKLPLRIGNRPEVVTVVLRTEN